MFNIYRTSQFEWVTSQGSETDRGHIGWYNSTPFSGKHFGSHSWPGKASISLSEEIKKSWVLGMAGDIRKQSVVIGTFEPNIENKER